MPPVRTEKKNSTPLGLAAYGFTKVPRRDAGAAAPNAPQPDAPQQAPKAKPKLVTSARLLPPTPKGVKDAGFGDSRSDWDGKFNKLVGTATKKLSFGGCFKLTDQHIEDVLALGPQVCAGVTEFKFTYGDVSYSANNDADGLTDTTITHLSLRCPKLRKFYLPGSSIGNVGLLSLLQNCPDLTYLELTGQGSSISGAAFEAFQAHPEWAPKLKKLRLKDQRNNRAFMKEMRALGKERTGLTIELVQTSERKRWGDWEL